jgi:arsenate reductase
MKQVGIDISDATAKSVFDLFRAGRIYHYVVTVCDEATAEQCPIFPGVCERLHWTFPDPSAAGSDSERLALAVTVREQIEARIRAWLAELETTGGPTPKFNRRES